MATLVAAGALAALGYGALAFLGGRNDPAASATDGLIGVIPSSSASQSLGSPAPTQPNGTPELSPSLPVTSLPPVSWTVRIRPSNDTPESGQQVIITATASGQVETGGLVIRIINQSTGAVNTTCTSGAICTAAVRRDEPGPRSYFAQVSSPDGSSVQAQSAVIVVTWAVPPRPTATPPGPTPPLPTPSASLPIVDPGSWDVAYNRDSTVGSPPVDLGDHVRRYELTSDCAAISDCRICALTYEADGDFVGRISFTWRGDVFEYLGDANYYRRDGGDTCTTAGGDVVENAYTIRELVRLRPERYRDGLIIELVGTKTVSGSPTTVGTAAGCEPYELTYSARLNT